MKEIRSNFVKESLLDYENLANSLKENTSNAVRDLLSETVRETYNQILNEEEDDDKDYEVEEVNDTLTDSSKENAEAEDVADEKKDDETSDEESEDTELSDDSDDSVEDEIDADSAAEDNNETDDALEDDIEDEPQDDNEDEWAQFEKYKVSDDEYDFSQANDDEIVKVYKLLKDDDQIMVNVDKESNKVELKDNETGAEYLLDLSSLTENNDVDDDLNIEDTDMNESRIFEIALNEYDSNVGYTDDYQSKDVMTTPSMKEPSKNTNDWDAGVPKGKEKPWANKGDNKPFEKEVNEEDDTFDNEEAVEEATNVGGFVQQNSTSKSHIPNSKGRKARNSSVAGVKTKSTSEPRYDNATNESKIMAKVNKILKENEELKLALGKFKTVLQEAAVTNVNLGQIIKLITENSTTKDEKQEIIARFGKEAKTVEQSKQLYETISRELKKNSKITIDEEKQFTTNSSKKINETPIYKSKDLMESLDLMHRLCK